MLFAFPAIPLPEAVRACEKLRLSIAQYPWSEIYPDLQVTISMGLSADTRPNHYEQMIAAADEKLYQAKNAGRNRIRY